MANRIVGNVLQHHAQVGFRINAVQLGCADQTVDSGRPFATRVRTREEIVLPSQGNSTQCPFGGVVVCALKRCTAFSGENPDRLALVPAGST